MKRPFLKLPKTVVALGAISLLTDLSSEMIYPLLPLFLVTELAAGALALGLIEGVAESTAALLKLFSGYWADKVSRRKPFILFGYGLAGLVRPCISLVSFWPWVLAIRFADRIGKGLRSSPRDALIAEATADDQRGRAYGFHRAMDHAGAVLGPLTAALLLHWAGWSLRQIFLLAFIPALLTIALIVFGVSERPAQSTPKKPIALRDTWTAMNPTLKGFIMILAVFSLGNATTAFLLLALSQAGLAAPYIAALWAGHHVIKMLSAYFSGIWADRFAKPRLITCGWLIHVFAYLAFAFFQDPRIIIPIFLLYGLSDGLAEPAEKALIAQLAHARLKGTGFGYYHMVIGLAALPASFLFGLIWYRISPGLAFLMNAVLALIAVSALVLWFGQKEPAAEG